MVHPPQARSRAAQIIQAQANGYFCRRRYQAQQRRREEAARRLQRSYRPRLRLLEAAALVVQRTYRGGKGRFETHARRERQTAAQVLQKIYRGSRVRVIRQRQSAVTMLQRLVRRTSQTRERKRKQKEKEALEEKVNFLNKDLPPHATLFIMFEPNNPIISHKKKQLQAREAEKAKQVCEILESFMLSCSLCTARALTHASDAKS